MNTSTPVIPLPIRLMLLLSAGVWQLGSLHYHLHLEGYPFRLAIINPIATLTLATVFVYVLGTPIQELCECSSSTSRKAPPTSTRPLSCPATRPPTQSPTRPAPIPISPSPASPSTSPRTSSSSRRAPSAGSPTESSLPPPTPFLQRSATSTTTSPSSSPDEIPPGAGTGPSPDSLTSLEASMSLFEDLEALEAAAAQAHRTLQSTINRLNKEPLQ